MATSTRFTFRTNAVAIGKLLIPIPQALNRAVMNHLSDVAEESMQNSIAEHTKSGVLALSYYNRQTPSKRGRELGHDLEIAPHAKWVIEGTAPHPIEARNAKALYFWWPKINDFFIGKRVNHPGYAGDDYINKAMVDAMREFPAIMAYLTLDEII